MPQNPEALSIVLAEYNALRDEITKRSGYQHQIIQLHVAALTAIVAGIFASKFGAWAFLVVPSESALFGLWYLDHALTIAHLSGHIQARTTFAMVRLGHRKELFTWESSYLNGSLKGSATRVVLFRFTVIATFFGPAVISLGAALNLLFVCVDCFVAAEWSDPHTVAVSVRWLLWLAGVSLFVLMLFSFCSLVRLQGAQRQRTPNFSSS